MQSWSEFYAMIGSVSATLLGLLFVVVSINVTESLSEKKEGSRRLSEQAFQNYLTVIMVALLAHFPRITTADLGLSIALTTAAWGAWVAYRMYLAFKNPYTNETGIRSLRRHITSLIGFGMLIYAALRMALGHNDNQNELAVSCMILLFSATMVSWRLLLGIAKTRAAEMAPPEESSPPAKAEV